MVHGGSGFPLSLMADASEADRSKSHPEYAVARLFERRVRGSGETQSQDHPGVHRVYNAVVPEPRGGVVGVPFRLVLLEDGPLELLALLVGHLLCLSREVVLLNGEEDVRGLLPPHNADAGVRPHPEEARRVGAAAHPVVACPEGPADDYRELRDVGVGDGHDHLGTVLGYAAGLVLFADHEARDVLQEDERDAAGGAQLYEVRALERALGEQDAVVGQNADGVTHDPGEATDQGFAVERLELVQATAVNGPGDDLPDVVALPVVARDDAVELSRIVQRLLWLLDGPWRRF